MEPIRSITIRLDDIEEGLHLIIDSKADNTLFVVPDAAENGEAQYQIVEGFTYDYELSIPEYSIAKDQIVQPHSRKKHLGTFSPNIYVGTLSIPILRDGKEMGKVYLEVQSVKTGYRDDYRNMLELITEKCTDLLMQANSPVSHNFETDFEKDNETLYQKFAFIKSIIATSEFSESVHRIVSSPVTKWEKTSEQKDIRNIRRFKNSNIKELITGSNRNQLPEGHYLREYGLQSLPGKISSVRKTDTVDTPENRFVKFALESFLKFCSVIHSKATPDSRLAMESALLEKELESYLHHSIFKEISRPDTLRLNSPVLQRKEGYREVLRVWLMFDLAAKLVWKGGEDVYEGGKKDIATLYEYWLFFKLLDMLRSVFDIEPEDISELIKVTSDGLNLQLKQGSHTALSGVFDTGTRKLCVRFNYNRSFSGRKDYPISGSWSTTMRPDYTLSMWPSGIDEREAEVQELIVHIHFDAKYKIANIRNIFNEASKQDKKTELGIINKFDFKVFSWDYIAELLINKGYAKSKNDEELSLLCFFWEEKNLESIGDITGEDFTDFIEIIQQSILSEEKENNRKGIYKNADLLKMHAYKDAIRRTAGAYVLYPGETTISKKGFHEIIPGLGAFPVRPSKTDDGISDLKNFILDVTKHFVNRASQREKMAYRTFDVYKNEPQKGDEVNEVLPETFGVNRNLIPDDTFVLVGFCKSDAHYSWYTEKGLYNFRMNDETGSLVLDEKTVKAKYLLLRRNGKAIDVFKIKSKGPKVFSKNKLLEMGYPEPSEPEYLVIEIDREHTIELGQTGWDYKNLKEYKRLEEVEKNPRILVGIPFTVSVSELMRTKHF